MKGLLLKSLQSFLPFILFSFFSVLISFKNDLVISIRRALHRKLKLRSTVVARNEKQVKK